MQELGASVASGRRLRLCTCGPPAYECLDDDQIVTQLSNPTGEFRIQPRLESESDLSILVGDLDFATAFRNVTGREPFEAEIAAQQVRRAQVGSIRAIGFAVVHTPNPKVRNSLHSSIVWPADPSVVPAVPWIEDMLAPLDLCFNNFDEKVKT
jgi:hypothetical protein